MGLFRISCQKSDLDTLIDNINKGNLDFSSLPKMDPHIFSCCLKKYLRELPEPLLLGSKYNTYVAALDEKEEDKKFAALKEAILSLPDANLLTLRTILQFLQIIISHEDENKMTSANLSIVFGPTFLWIDVDDPSQLFTQTQKVSILVKELIDHYEYFFGDNVR